MELDKQKVNLMIWWLGLICLTLPSYLVRFNLGVPTTLLEINIYLFTLVGIILFWKERAVVGKILREKLQGWWWPIGLFLLAAVIGAMVSPDKREALGILKAYFVDPILIFGWLVILVKERADYRKIVGALGLSVVWLAVIAGLQGLHLWPALEPWASETPRRVSAVLEHPNALGLYVAPITGLYLGLLLLGKNLQAKERMFGWVVVLCGILAAGLAVSAGALAAIGVAAVVCGMKSKYWKVIIMALALLAVLAALWGQMGGKLGHALTEKVVSGGSRVEIWRDGLTILKDRWLLGAGLSGMDKVNEQSYHFKLLGEHLYLHNILLTFWMETGLLGLISFIWLLGAYFRRGWRLWKRDDDWRKVASGALIIAMVALLVHGMVDNPYFKNDLAMEFWVLAGLMVRFF